MMDNETRPANSSDSSPAEEPKCEECGHDRMKHYYWTGVNVSSAGCIEGCTCQGYRPPTTEPAESEGKYEHDSDSSACSICTKEGLHVPDWHIRDTVRNLVEAAHHLLHKHDCDGHGHETYAYAMRAGKKWLDSPTASPAESVEDRAKAFPMHGRSANIELMIGFAQAEIDRQRPAIEQAAVDRFVEEVAEEVKAHATDCELFVFTEAMQTVREKMKWTA